METTKFTTGAVRSADAQSTRYDLISPIGMRRLAETYAEGAAKYGDHNWLKGFPSGDLLNHLMKHIDQFRMGDTSEDHLSHACWGLFALMHFQETQPGLIENPPWRPEQKQVGNLAEFVAKAEAALRNPVAMSGFVSLSDGPAATTAERIARETMQAQWIDGPHPVGKCELMKQSELLGQE